MSSGQVVELPFSFSGSSNTFFLAHNNNFNMYSLGFKPKVMLSRPKGMKLHASLDKKPIGKNNAEGDEEESKPIKIESVFALPDLHYILM